MSWLDQFPQVDGYYQITPSRSYTYDEETFDDKLPAGFDAFEAGRGVAHLYRYFGGRADGRLLEVGCGSGYLAPGLARSLSEAEITFSDMSTSFIRVCRRKLERLQVMSPRIAFCTLDADNFDMLPAGHFSLICIRAALHHILDVGNFFSRVSRVLEPGGMLIFQEPFAEGHIVIGALAECLLGLAPSGDALSPEQREQLRLLADTMQFYCDRSIDKSGAEDKHLFRVQDIYRWGREAALDVSIFVNRSYAWFAYDDDVDAVMIKPTYRLSTFMQEFLQYEFRFDAQLLEYLDRHLVPVCGMLDKLSVQGDGPCLEAVGVCRKVAA